MRWGHTARGLIGTLAIVACAVLMPLAVAADTPSSAANLPYFITRLGVPDVTPPPAPSPATKPTTPAASSVQSFRFTAQGQISIASPKDTVKLSLNGEASLPSNVHMMLTLSDTSSSQPIGPLEVVVIGTTPYVHLTGKDSPTGKDIWVLVDNPNGMSGLPGANLPGLANIPPPTTQTQTLGDETINGTLTTHTRTTIDATALLGGSAKGAKPSTLTLDLWAGKSDNFPRRMTINGSLSIDPTALANLAGNTSSASATSIPPVDATLTFSMDFTDLNTPVTITAPASYSKLSDLLKQ